MPTQKIVKDDSFLFAGQSIAEEQDNLAYDSLDAWTILIVDDEPEVHSVTTMALNGVVIENKKLEFLHARSAKEAEEILSQNNNIAVIFLDVVMETDDAGLQLVKKIRHKLNLNEVRIILRTGQPGHAPEHDVVSHYEIDNYITKTDMTRTKLFTSLYAAIRSYQQIKTINGAKDFLQRLAAMNSTLISQQNLSSFVRCLVKESLELFQANGPSIFLLNQSEKSGDAKRFKIEYSTESMYSFKGQDFEEVLPSPISEKLKVVIKNGKSTVDDNDLILFIPSTSCTGALVIFDASPEIVRSELIQSFVSNIASDLDNSLLLRKISDIAYLDSLTNLPNRAMYIQKLDSIGQPVSQHDTLALVDIEHFSDINDGLGQDAGNALIIAVAERLVAQLGNEVEVCRVGADIFGLVGTQKNLEAEKILATFDFPFKAGEHLIPINARVGICFKPTKKTSGMSLIKRANIALNLAKKDSQNRANYYLPDMEDQTTWRLEMIRKLTDDFFDQKLQVWFQPQICLSSKRVIGVEALLRWPDGKGSFISPLTFIPLAEYTGLIVEIGNWVLEQACQEINKLGKAGFDNIRVAVNVSMPQFRHSNFVEKVVGTAAAFNVDSSRIELEITESVVMDDTNMVVDALEELRSLGFTVAIDDFGTGFSSLSYLNSLPLNRLKVDREFIKDIGEGGSGILAETIIGLGQKLGMEIIAEGIETEYQLNYVTELGCNEAQGFYHAKPMPSQDLIPFLQNFSFKKD